MGDPIRHSKWFYWHDWHRYVGVSHDHVAPSPLQMAADLGMSGAQVMAWLTQEHIGGLRHDKTRL